MRRSLYDYCVENNRIELLDQWDEAANLPQTPHTITYGSKQKVAWRCEKGHKWRAHIYARTGNSTGCPVCAGLTVIPGENDLATLFPALAAQWHPTKNMGVTPADVGAFTHRKAWWRCPQCGHEWSAEIKSRANGCGCPMCAGKVRTRSHPRYQYVAMEAPRPVINRRTGFGRDSPVQGSPPGMTKTGTDPP